MNNAERRRDLKIRAMTDLDLLAMLIADGDVTSEEGAAFASMRVALCNHFGESVRCSLSTKQRAWAEDVARRVMPLDSKDVPRGREVVKPSVLRGCLPKKPPRRSTSDDT